MYSSIRQRKLLNLSLPLPSRYSPVFGREALGSISGQYVSSGGESRAVMDLLRTIPFSLSVSFYQYSILTYFLTLLL